MSKPTPRGTAQHMWEAHGLLTTDLPCPICDSKLPETPVSKPALLVCEICSKNCEHGKDETVLLTAGVLAYHVDCLRRATFHQHGIEVAKIL